MDLGLGDVDVLNKFIPPAKKIIRRERKREGRARRMRTSPKVVVTGLGRIKDARQKLNEKKTVQDARFKIENKKNVAFDARSKINAKQKSTKPFDARQKIKSKTKQPQDGQIFVPKVTITGLGSIGPRGFGGGDDVNQSLTFRRTIQNDTAAAAHIKDLVITTKQAVKRRPSPVRPPVILAAKQSRPDPIRPQATTAHQGNIIKLPKAYTTTLPRPQPQVAPQKKKPVQQQAISQMSVEASPLQGFKLFITNLGNLVSHDDILELFGSLGAIKRARIVKPGQAEVIYVKKEDAAAAIAQYHLRELDGLPMNVVLVTPTPIPAPAPKQPTPEKTTVGPLRLSKGATPAKKKLDIDPDLIHSALFKSKEKRPSKPVSFSITI